jgi:predicted dehydrogenase
MSDHRLGVGIVGCGGIALANHLPGFALCPEVDVVALCDADPGALERARQSTGIATGFSDWKDLVAHDRVDAVVIATPNRWHHDIAVSTAGRGKHVLCEKPLAMSTADARAMLEAAEKAGVRHLTAFTYRFVPAMRWMKHLLDDGAIGKPVHFRVERLQDWGQRGLGWRQRRSEAGTGEIGDMLSHRLDYGHYLVGPIARLVAKTRLVVPEREGVAADVEDWVGCLAEFVDGTTGVFESTKTAYGRGDGPTGLDRCEINGTEGTLLYELGSPLRLWHARRGGRLESLDVPVEFRKVPGSPRNVAAGDPLQTFRYDQDFEFVQAIREQRPCRPSFDDGLRVQAVMDAIVTSARDDRWVSLP